MPNKFRNSQRPLRAALVFTAAICFLLPLKISSAQNPPASKVTLLKDAQGKWQLTRNGQPYRIHGAGGGGSLELLAEYGGNSTRTWGTDNALDKLDEAHANNVTVAVGVWLGQIRQGMDYQNFDSVSAQIDKTLADVRSLKDHPALLVWGLGNEMEAPASNDNPAIWSHIEFLASAVKKIDPNHPVMTVVAGIGDRKIEAIHRLCPSVDIIGINAYGECVEIPEKYRELTQPLLDAGIERKPYIVTEFGPTGWWEVPKNEIDTVEELTSNAKADDYRAAQQSLDKEPQLCLGSYAFIWGNKQETTATWFSMLLPDGRKTNMVDVMSESWTGKSVANLCPTIDEMKLLGSKLVDPNTTVTVSLKVADPEGKPLNVKWKMVNNKEKYGTGGDFEEASTTVDESFISGDLKGAKFKAPEDAGLYRIYAYVDDGLGVATANVPIRVTGAEKLASTQTAALPVKIFDEPETVSPFIPAGFMGSTDALTLEAASTEDPAVGKHCMKVTYSKDGDWAGVVWQSPEGDWGDKPGGLDFTGAQKLSFRVRGEEDGIKVKFGMGLIGSDKPYFDTANREQEFSLTKTWQKKEFDLSGSDLTRIKSAFFFSLAGQGKPFTFYLDDIVVD
jgi:hypothetical protein